MATQSSISYKVDQKLTEEPSTGGTWARLHHTHRRALVNGIMYCEKCGQFAIKKVEGLADPCNGKPLNNYGVAQLKKLNRGMHPVRGALTWPDGTNTTVTWAFGLL